MSRRRRPARGSGPIPPEAGLAATEAASAEEPLPPVLPRLGLASPPLIHPGLGFSLRPWGSTPTDGQALVGAWTDPEVSRFTEVPQDPSLAAADRWIAREEQRRERGIAIDLVISELGAPEHVWGEVGLVVVEPEQRWAEIGYWVTPAARGRGVATAAVSLVVGWVERSLPIARVVARTHPDNPASGAVAVRAGLASAGSLPDGTAVWTLDLTR